MWNLLNCYLSRRHEFGVWCEPGTIFLRCIHCGARSSGWAVHAAHAPVVRTPVAAVTVTTPVPAAARVLPFERAAAAR